MTDTRKLLLLFGAIGAGLLAWSAWNGAGTAPEQPPWAGLKIDWGKPARHGCDADWMSAVLPTQHPVYRQWKPGGNRDGLCRYGWSWISDPPGERDVTPE